MIGALLAALLATADVGVAEKGDLHDDSMVVTNVNESAFVKWGETQGKTLRITGGFGPGSSSTGGVDIAGSTLKAYGTELYPGIVRLHSPASPRMGSYLDVGSGAGIYFEGTGDMPLPAAYGLYGWESLDQRIRRLAPSVTESDPVFTEWRNAGTGYVQTESDPVFTRWTETNRYVKAESDPVFSGWIGDELGGTNVFRAKTDLVVYDGTPQSPTADRLVTVSGVKGLIAGATNSLPSGAARPLPPYLHHLEFADSYADEAAAYYRSRGNGKACGGCSAVRDGNFLCRNFDYPFDERAEFVVKMSAGPNRFASVGVAQVGTNLTEQFVVSGKPSRRYKWLPGATVDGINECGVAVTINVTDDVPSWHSAGSLHPLGVVRWILDHATNALHGAEYVAANVRFPSGWTQNFHYMVADREKTYLVENGEVYDFDDYHESDEPATMTNFPLNRFPWSGMGMERFGLLLRGESITNAWYTRAYRRETTPPWVSEFSADVLARTNEIFNAWASHPREYFRGKTNGGEPWWQTVHTSVYDIEALTLRISVQESGDWYSFAVAQGGKVKSVNGFTGDVTLTADDVGALTTNLVGKTLVSGTGTVFRLGAGTKIEGTDDGTYTLGGGTITVPENLDVTVRGDRTLATWGIKDALPKSGGTADMMAGFSFPGHPTPVSYGGGADHVDITNGMVIAETVPKMLGNIGSTASLSGGGLTVRNDVRRDMHSPPQTNLTTYGSAGFTRRISNSGEEFTVRLPDRPGTLALDGYIPLSDVTNAQGNAVSASDVGALPLSGGAMTDGATVTIRSQGNVSPTYIRTELSASGLSVKSVNSRGGATILAIVDSNGIVLNGGGMSVGSSTGFLGGSDTTYANGKIVQNLRGGTSEVENTLPEESGTLATREWVGDNESDPTVPDWAKATNPPTETDPTVPGWAKQTNPPTETDPTVPGWAKLPNPPQGMDYEAMTNTVNETKSRYFDSGLGVEWTFVPMNGEFMFIATTNVNREVIE